MHETGWSVGAWGLPVLFWSLWASVARISSVWGQTRQDVKTEFRLIVIRAGLNETFTSASCVICNWLPYLSFIIASASHVRIFISQIFISDLYIFTFIFRSSYFETTSCLHTFGSSSSSHTVLILSSSRFHHAIIITTLQLDIFTSSKLHLSPLSGQPSSSINEISCCALAQWGRKPKEDSKDQRRLKEAHKRFNRLFFPASAYWPVWPGQSTQDSIEA